MFHMYEVLGLIPRANKIKLIKNNNNKLTLGPGSGAPG